MSHEPPPSGRCGHWIYRMACDDFDSLVAACDARCAICRRSASETGHGHLCIDHDPRIGHWAVRGLLCSTCNCRVSVDCAATPADAAYLAEPWWIEWLERRGTAAALRMEPRVGEVIYQRLARRRARVWQRTRSGWITVSRDGPKGVQTWRDLNYLFGPHDLLNSAPTG